MKRRKNESSLYDEFRDFFIKIYLFFVIGIFPFVYNNNFIDITKSKKMAFQWVAIPFVVVGIVIWIYESVKNKKIKLGLMDYSVFFFIASVLVSSFISSESKEAIWGETGRQLGGVYLILCAMVCLVVSKIDADYKFLIKVMFVANTLQFLLIIANFLGNDILGMYPNLIKSEHNYFLGTIGNINVNAAYASIITALAMVVGYFENNKKNKMFILAFITMGIFVCLCSRSDSWLIAIGIAFVILVIHAMEKREKLYVVIQYFACLILASATMMMLKYIENNTKWDNLWIKDIDTRKLQCLLISKEIIALEVLLLIIATLLIRSKAFEFIKKHGRKIVYVLLAVVVVAVMVIVFPLEDSFGSHRGFIWKRSINTYIEFPIINKLFGYGPNCFYQALKDKYAVEMVEVCGGIFIDAHNEILQFLIVTGIMGVIGYVGMQVITLIKSFKNANSPEGIFGIVFIIAFMAQGLVNNPTSFTTPLLFVLMGLINCQLDKKK